LSWADLHSLLAAAELPDCPYGPLLVAQAETMTPSMSGTR
jgi:hypothetical protein